MGYRNKKLLNVLTGLSLTIFLLVPAINASEKVYRGRYWQLTLLSFEDGLEAIPVIGGLVAIAAEKGQEGVVIKGVVEPTAENLNFIIELDQFKLIAGDEEFSPATADVSAAGQENVESIQWPAGKSSAMSKKDFPATISIMYLVTKSPQKALFLRGGRPATLTAKE